MSKKYQVSSVHRAFDILDLLNTNGDFTFTEIKEILELPNSTCYNLLNTLEKRGFVQRNHDNGHYTLGMKLMQLGLSAYNKFDLSKVARQHLRKLSEQFEETSYLTALNKTNLRGVIIDCLYSDRTGLVYSRNIGDVIPLYASGTGKSLLSGFDNEELNSFFKEVKLVPFTSQTITQEDILREEIKEIRKNGYAISRAAYEEGVISVSAPINDFSGKIIASVSLVGPIGRVNLKLDKVIEAVKETAVNISKELN